MGKTPLETETLKAVYPNVIFHAAKICAAELADSGHRGRGTFI